MGQMPKKATALQSDPDPPIGDAMVDDEAALEESRKWSYNNLEKLGALHLNCALFQTD